MGSSITVHLEIFKRPQLSHFSTDLDEAGIKIHGLLSKIFHINCSNSPRARNRFNQTVEAKMFEGVFLCRKMCRIQKSNS